MPEGMRRGTKDCPTTAAQTACNSMCAVFQVSCGLNGWWIKWAMAQMDCGPNEPWLKWASDQMGSEPTELHLK